MFNSTTSNAAATTVTKLRDSCEACATAKLKCHRQKPTCSRCAKRGITCQYLATRRSGRRPDSRRAEHKRATSFSLSNTPSLDQLDLSAWFGTYTTSPGDDCSPLHHSTGSTSSTSSNASGLDSNLVTPVDLSDLTTDLDDYFSSPTSMWMPDTTSTDMLGQLDNDFFNMTTNINDIKSNDYINNELNRHINNMDTRSDHSQKTDDFTDIEAHLMSPEIPKSLCCCLMQAMGLLQQLLPLTPAKAGGTGSSTPQSMDCQSPSMVSVIATNKHAVDALEAMLECQCSQGGYLLVYMSLIVFKVLESYTAAANTIQSHTPLSSVEGLTYTTAQTVLGELHRIQRLVNQLSTHMKKQAAVGGQRKGVMTPVSPGERSVSNSSMQISDIILDQLEVDMRGRVKCLSLGMVTHLRRITSLEVFSGSPMDLYT